MHTWLWIFGKGLRMTGKKDLNPKPQIRENPSNPWHPCSLDLIPVRIYLYTYK